MTKGRRATPARGLRSPLASPKTASKRPLDSQRIAVEIVAAIADAVIVTGLDRRAPPGHPPPAGPFGRPPPNPPRTPTHHPPAPRRPGPAPGHAQAGLPRRGA